MSALDKTYYKNMIERRTKLERAVVNIGVQLADSRGLIDALDVIGVELNRVNHEIERLEEHGANVEWTL